MSYSMKIFGIALLGNLRGMSFWRQSCRFSNAAMLYVFQILLIQIQSEALDGFFLTWWVTVSSVSSGARLPFVLA
jgi:hypothetical protein